MPVDREALRALADAVGARAQLAAIDAKRVASVLVRSDERASDF
jgi:LDH2 family malate/lactate/ureidoglycolate dehydrogenase